MMRQWPPWTPRAQGSLKDFAYALIAGRKTNQGFKIAYNPKHETTEEDFDKFCMVVWGTANTKSHWRWFAKKWPSIPTRRAKPLVIMARYYDLAESTAYTQSICFSVGKKSRKPLSTTANLRVSWCKKPMTVPTTYNVKQVFPPVRSSHCRTRIHFAGWKSLQERSDPLVTK